MFQFPYQKPDQETAVAPHAGVFRKQISLYEGVALVTSGTIGAGVIGIPYAVAQVGMLPGLALMLFIGLLMMGMNLIVGDISMRSSGNHQLPGFAERYLGAWGKWLMTIIIFLSLFGALLVYIIGEGETLSALFGGEPFRWSVGFFVVATALIAFGIRTIKTLEVFLSLGILAVVVAIAMRSAPQIDPALWGFHDLSKFLIPYGVLVFAYHGTSAVPEAWSIMKDREWIFKKAIIIAGVIVMAVYAVFTLVVVGVTGKATTEIATIGLGQAVGPVVFVLGNLFAAIAMVTTFLMAGVAMRDSLAWDFRVPRGAATALVCGLPFLAFLFGIRGFIKTIDLVGGVFMTVELLLILLIWFRARKQPSTRLTVKKAFGTLKAQ